MFQHLKLSRPLAVFDLEATGTDPATDRIVEICIYKFLPDGTCIPKSRLINPTIPIPPDAIDIHHITDEMVKDAPTFKQVAKGMLEFLEGCDLCGYNLVRYDLRLLRMEFKRAGLDFNLDGRNIVDPMMIYHKYEKRDLTAAAKFYVNEDHADAHRAEPDVKVTVKILDEMVRRYAVMPKAEDCLPNTPEGLQVLLKPECAEDADGRFRRIEGEIRFTFSKQYRGQSLDWVAKSDPGFLRWMLASDFSEDTKRVVREALVRAGNA
jgi:DNA polymerase-3 subunit epsilon